MSSLFQQRNALGKRLWMKVCIRVMMNGCICVKQMLLKGCVYTDVNTERREMQNERTTNRAMRRKVTKGRRSRLEEKKKINWLVCVILGGNLGDHLPPLGPSLAPARSLQGSLGSWGKTSRPPSPLNPVLGCLPWPGCLTALLMLHTGTQGPWVREGAGTQGERRRKRAG